MKGIIKRSLRVLLVIIMLPAFITALVMMAILTFVYPIVWIFTGISIDYAISPMVWLQELDSKIEKRLKT